MDAVKQVLTARTLSPFSAALKPLKYYGGDFAHEKKRSPIPEGGKDKLLKVRKMS
jgi:hypothetical protein